MDPLEPLDADGILNAPLPMAFRGYDIASVDELLARISEEVADRDRTIAGLRAALRRAEKDVDSSRIALSDARRSYEHGR